MSINELQLSKYDVYLRVQSKPISLHATTMAYEDGLLTFRRDGDLTAVFPLAGVEFAARVASESPTVTVEVAEPAIMKAATRDPRGVSR